METKHIAPKEQVKHIGSDMQFKHTGSKGRRTHNNTVANPDHGRWNFLKTHGNVRPTTAFTSNLRETRFHKGFQRRKRDEIKLLSKDLSRYSETKKERNARNFTRRQNFFAEKSRLNGNIITGQDMPVNITRGRRHLSQCSPYSQKEARVREKLSMGRFESSTMSASEVHRNKLRQHQRVNRILCSRSSVLVDAYGKGKSELQSLGSLDNFGSLPLIPRRPKPR
ncbi:hypothetical protein AAMO2058_001186100 [Amorphochlora amoebiformis]